MLRVTGTNRIKYFSSKPQRLQKLLINISNNQLIRLIEINTHHVLSYYGSPSPLLQLQADGNSQWACFFFVRLVVVQTETKATLLLSHFITNLNCQNVWQFKRETLITNKWTFMSYTNHNKSNESTFYFQIPMNISTSVIIRWPISSQK